MKKLLVVALALAAQPALAHDYSISGPRIEARLGWETPTISGIGGSSSVYKLGNGVSYGGEVGYDLKVSKKVSVGPYANYEFSSVNDCNGSYCLGSDGNFSVGGRVTVALGSKAAIYGKLGYDQMSLTASVGSASASHNLSGVGGGIGIEYSIHKSVYVGFDANYADLGSFSGANFQRRQVAFTLGTRF